MNIYALCVSDPFGDILRPFRSMDIVIVYMCFICIFLWETWEQYSSRV